MEKNNQIEKPMFNILIVDDVPANLKVLGEILKHEGYKIRPVLTGELALEVAEKEIPDIVLLDIMLPGIDGFTVCESFKNNPKLSKVPIIFISALDETSKIVKALNVGGADYITKPFRLEEVKARVETHLKINQQQKELEELVAVRDRFFSIIAHDLKNPFQSFIGLSEILINDFDFFPAEEIKNILKDMNISAHNVHKLLENLLEWANIQKKTVKFNPKIINIFEIVVANIYTFESNATFKDISIINEIEPELTAYADSYMLDSILRNLLSNGIKFSNKNSKVVVKSEKIDDSFVKISVIDEGVGIPELMLENLFKLDQKNGRKGTNNEPSTGLGLMLCKEFVEIQGGKIWAESEEGVGSKFYFTLPLEKVLSS